MGARQLNNYCVYPVSEEESYRLGILVSLLAIKTDSDNWCVLFNEENGEGHDDELQDNDIITMINDICSQ